MEAVLFLWFFFVGYVQEERGTLTMQQTSEPVQQLPQASKQVPLLGLVDVTTIARTVP